MLEILLMHFFSLVIFCRGTQNWSSSQMSASEMETPAGVDMEKVASVHAKCLRRTGEQMVDRKMG